MTQFNDMKFGERYDFQQVIVDVKNRRGRNLIQVNIAESDFIFLQYFLGDNLFYAVIVDDYPFEIVDTKSLLEAVFYQSKLIHEHTPDNWDEFIDGLAQGVAKDFSSFEGFCLMFKRGVALNEKLSEDLERLTQIMRDFENYRYKNFKIIIA